MLARELLDGGQPPLDTVLARGIKIERFAVVLQLARGLAHLDGRLFDQRQRGAELGVEAATARQRLQRATHGGVRAAAVVLVELGARQLRALCQSPAVGEPRALLGEGVRTHRRLSLQRLQLLRLVAQQSSFASRSRALVFELEACC